MGAMLCQSIPRNAACTELAAAARTARSKALFLELSQSWEKLAIQLEDAIIENEDITSYVRELRTHGNPLVRPGPPL